MNDLIYRQDAIKALNAYVNNDHCITDFDATSVLLDLPSAGAEWIPCSERLPEKRQNVIVTVNDGYAIYTETDEWTGTGFLIYGDEVIAWMPLPEPYRIPQSETE